MMNLNDYKVTLMEEALPPEPQQAPGSLSTLELEIDGIRIVQQVETTRLQDREHVGEIIDRMLWLFNQYQQGQA